jgi:hypothetical protein
MTYDLMGLQKRNHCAGDRPLFECRRHHKSKMFFKAKEQNVIEHPLILPRIDNQAKHLLRC